jgi:hypothetical protein
LPVLHPGSTTRCPPLARHTALVKQVPLFSVQLLQQTDPDAQPSNETVPAAAHDD